MESKNNPKGREDNIVVQESNGELLLYDLTTNKAYCLNPTSAAIWNLCDGNRSLPDITKQLSKQLKQPVTDDLVWLAIDQFKTDSLLSGSNEIEIKLGGLSRREVIRKVGVATMVALPAITSIVAPIAAMAQSGLAGVGGACVNPNDCRPCANGNTVQCRNNNAVCPTGTAKCCDCS